MPATASVSVSTSASVVGPLEDPRASREHSPLVEQHPVDARDWLRAWVPEAVA